MAVTSAENATTTQDTTHSPGDGWVRESDLRPLLTAMQSIRDGDLRIRLPVRQDGIVGELAAELTHTADRNRHLTDELNRVCREVAKQGRLDREIEKFRR